MSTVALPVAPRKAPGSAPGGGTPPSLDNRTQLGFQARTHTHTRPPGWYLNDWATAGEASAFWSDGSIRVEGDEVAPTGSDRPRAGLHRSRVLTGEAAAAEDHERSIRRSRGRLRRYAVHNRLGRLVSLTYAGTGCHDFDRMRADVALFERRLREAFPALAFEFTYELHPGGHGWHVHGGVSARIPQARLAALWGHGFADIRMIRLNGGRRFPGRAGGTGREMCRRVAVYLSKYVGKEAEGIPAGRQRYSVRQGFQPVCRRVFLGCPDDVARAMLVALGGEVPSYVWSSSGAPEWIGPPAEYVAFG